MADDWPGQRLHQYAIFDRDDSLRDLLMGEELSNIDAPDMCQRTPVFTAVSNNSIKCLELLLANGANPSIPGGKRVNCNTPLHQAVMDDKREMIQVLLRYGADTNIADDSGLSPLNLARNIGSPEILKIFEEEDESRKQKALESVLDLCQACRDCDAKKVKDILDATLPASGWELPNTVGPGEVTTPLAYAARSGDSSIMKELLGRVLKIERMAEVIHGALEGGHLAVVKLILKNSPDCCNVCNVENESPLHVACKLGHSDIVKCLLEWPYPEYLRPSMYTDRDQTCYKIAVNVNALTNDKKTPLYLACENGHVEIVKYLLDFQVIGTRLGPNNANSSTQSHCGEATDSALIYPVRLCKEFGSDDSGSSSYDSDSSQNGMDLSTSCLYISVKNGYHEIVMLLLQTGAKTNITMKLDNTEYSAILLTALENEDLLMIDKLFTYKVEDVNSCVLKRAIQRKPAFIHHFLKYKSSIDQHYSINKVAMRQEYDSNFLKPEVERSCGSNDPLYPERFPTNPVYVRWQNLHFLTVIHEKWLTCVGNHNNPHMSNVNIRVPLFAITRVDVSNNSLTMLPSSLLQLPSLSVLTVTKNKITEFPKLENFSLDCELLEEMDVSENLLTALPSYLFTDLPALKSLNASRNKIKVIPGTVWHTKSLKTLDLNENLLETLPKPGIWVRHASESEQEINLSQGYNRKTSVLSDNITDPDLAKPNDMSSYDVRKINHWSPKLISDEAVKAAETKKGLKTLKLSKNHLTEFPDFLSCCAPQLQTLEMSKNRLSSLGLLASYPKLLKNLDLSSNQILDMVDWLMKLAPGQVDDTYCEHKLNPNRTGTCGHRSHLKLENLEELDLSSNKLACLTLLRETDSVGKKVGSSSSMTQSMHDIEVEAQDLQRKLLFPNLSNLQIGSNQLESLPEEVGELKSLKVLSLKKNAKLKELPAKLGLLDKLNRIEVELCPIEGPIQDIMKGDINPAKDVVGFLRSVLEESEEYNCMNLMVVGAYAKGKTSLLQQLAKWGTSSKERTHFVQREENQSKATTVDDKPLSTVGIDISHLIFEGKIDGKQRKVEFRTWDFAGQKEYYATHQYFLSPRSLYLVVWNLTTGEAGVEELRQWLVNIQAQAPNSPVIIVGTHLDEIKEKKKHYPPTWEDNMAQIIREKYHIQDADKSGLPKLIGVINVCCTKGKKGENIEKLKTEIFNKVFELKHPGRRNEKLLGHKVPKKYILLQDCIKEIAEDRKRDNKEPVLDDDTYVVSVMNKMTPLAESKLTKSTGFRNKEDLYQATRFLHEIGVLCHFEDLMLKGQYFIDPQWLSDQLAKVVSAQEIRNYAADGVMKITHLDSLYKNSSRISKFILSLLNKFEVALQFDKDHLILPSLLPTDRNLEHNMMKEIPVKRHEDGIPSRSGSMGSVYSIGISTFFQELPTGKEGDLYIIGSKAEKNPMFSSTRLYLMTYFPSGFWPRLITRILNDETFLKPAVEMYPFSAELSEKCPDIRKDKTVWRCWQTGFELVFHGNVILQVKEVRTGTGYSQGMCNYDVDNLAMKCHFDNDWADLEIKDSVILEISFQANKITFYFGAHQSCQNQSFQSMDSKDIYAEERAQAEILAKIVDHIDSLLQDWYPEIGEARFIQNCIGRYLVTRVIPCPQCLQEESRFQEENPGSWEVLYTHTDKSERLSLGTTAPLPDAGSRDDEQGASSKRDERILCTFLVENCIQNVFDGFDEVCIKHASVSPKVMNCNGTNRMLYVAPDLVFHDLDPGFVVDDETLHMDKKIGKGAFGIVYAGELRRESAPICKVAVKILYTEEDKEQKRALASQMALEKVCQAYTTARQEVSILQTVHHPHILPLLGFSRRPLALLLALAPMGSLQDLLEKRHKEGLRLPVFVIKQVVIQVADALDYLHNRSIIYRDLKSDNVLVWHFPKSSDSDPKQPVTVKIADYGISRSVMPAGAKGYGGTPPFIAPEILVHAGRDIYTEKVDIFSFGMFMFELLTCRAPLADINNPAVHVCNGGRPNITSEEANYPSHFLDLMSICWEHDPLCRPTAAQIRMIASCPQFCHLADAVSMETQAVVLSTCSVTSGVGTQEDPPSQEDQSQVWMATQVGGETRNAQYHVEVFLYNKKSKFVAAKELKQDARIIGLCVVNQAVWCLDKTGTLHEYSTKTFEQTNTLTLMKNNKEDLKAMFHYHGSKGGHVVLLFQYESQKVTTLFHLPEDAMSSKAEVKAVDILEKCFCAAAVETLAGPRIWIGTTKGSVLVKSPSDWDKDEGTLNPYHGPVTSSELSCMFIASSSSKDLQHYAWTYNYQGSKVFCWDVNNHEVVSILDCANIIPAVDSHKILKLRTFEAKQYQVTAMSVIDKYIYVSTTWGCVIVADAASLQPYSAFRCHGSEEFYCKAILPLGSASKPRELYSRLSSGFDDAKSECQGVVTIGRGYVDLINHVTNLEKQALIREDSEDGWSLVETGSVVSSQPMKLAVSSHTHVLSWLTDQWEYY